MDGWWWTIGWSFLSLSLSFFLSQRYGSINNGVSLYVLISALLIMVGNFGAATSLSGLTYRSLSRADSISYMYKSFQIQMLIIACVQVSKCQTIVVLPLTFSTRLIRRDKIKSYNQFRPSSLSFSSDFPTHVFSTFPSSIFPITECSITSLFSSLSSLGGMLLSLDVWSKIIERGSLVSLDGRKRRLNCCLCRVIWPREPVE